jgi:hypothetical protein
MYKYRLDSTQISYLKELIGKKVDVVTMDDPSYTMEIRVCHIPAELKPAELKPDELRIMNEYERLELDGIVGEFPFFVIDYGAVVHKVQTSTLFNSIVQDVLIVSDTFTVDWSGQLFQYDCDFAIIFKMKGNYEFAVQLVDFPALLKFYHGVNVIDQLDFTYSLWHIQCIDPNCDATRTVRSLSESDT